MKKLMICLILSTVLLVSCTSKKDSNKLNTGSNSDKNTVQNSNDEKKDTTQTSNNTTEKTDSALKNDVKISDTKINDISSKVKSYILNEQGEKPEADKLKWSKAFLEQVDMKSMYSKYLKDGGTDGDIEWFAKYITLYSPVPSNWKEMFKKDVYDIYQENIVNIKATTGDLYTGYIKVNGVETPYFIVSPRTGSFHGTSNSENTTVKAKVQVYAGSYFDSKCYGENRPNPYNEVVISNITDTSFDFTVNELEYTDIKNSAKQTRKLIFKTNTAVFIEDGTKAAFYGKDYTLIFTFPNDHGAFPVVTDMKITGFKPLEGNTYLNNGIPGHEFG